MTLDQIPVDRLLGKQRANVFVRFLQCRPEPLQVFPVPYSRHQLDAKQKGQSVDRRTLCLRIAMQNVGLNVGFVLGQSVENVDGLPDTAGDEVRKQRDVGIADVVVGHPAIAAVPYVALRKQVVFVQVPLGAVGGSMLGIAPISRQLEPVVGVDGIADRGLKFFGGGLALIDEGDLPCADVGDVAGRLGRP